VERQLFSDNNRIIVLGASDAPVNSRGEHEILGYAVASKEVLEWVHVRKGLRGNGLAGVLLRELGFSLTSRPLSRWRTRVSTSLALQYRPTELRK
jgi:hypothetical protein